ncbi:hypothetical protein SAY87_014134 [Trapa incisa]|uniref:DUF4005 domain-containing protein n=2 Tax=Trapa TaxID=22665 RepID=A0AAN7RN55_TRANT|nr:hypothetical protein SAY87_014134 [Trapa incisa]KAK4802488.1 hypothetical protein SAY86_000691 [Trapa natans]
MGKKGSWFSAIKKAFVSHSKDKPTNNYLQESDKKDRKSKGHGERKSFIPLFREPSSIEKILADAEREHNIIFRPPIASPPLQQANTRPYVAPLNKKILTDAEQEHSIVLQPPTTPYPPVQANTTSSVPPIPLPTPPDPSSRPATPREPSVKAASPCASSRSVASPRGPSQQVTAHEAEISHPAEPSQEEYDVSATKIQAAYRGYKARRSFKSIRGLKRLQVVVKGQIARRQTMNAVKHMQLFVRVQSQIQSRRFRAIEDQAKQHQAHGMEVESNTDAPNHKDNWDVSLLTKEEVDDRLHRKVEAAIKRERAMSYAYSNQLRNSTMKAAHASLSNIHSGGYRRWWNWHEKLLPRSNATEVQSQSQKNYRSTPSRLQVSSSNKQACIGYNNTDSSATPRSTRSPFQMKFSLRSQSSSSKRQTSSGYNNTDQPATPRSIGSSFRVLSSKFIRTPPPRDHSTSNKTYLRTRATSGTESPFSLKDDDSLMSCPPFSVPSYMTPTISARAKARACSNPRGGYPGTPTAESNSSVNSAMSLPVGAIARKPFNRFV